MLPLDIAVSDRGVNCHKRYRDPNTLTFGKSKSVTWLDVELDFAIDHRETR